MRLVPENRLCATMIEMLNVEGVVLEPAGALAIDALKDFPRKEIRGKTIVCVVSGGNFDFERLPDVKERALRFEGLKKYFVFRFPQRPGALRDFLELLGPDDDIARFEYLKKSARNFGSVLIGIETKDRQEFRRAGKTLPRSGLGLPGHHGQRDHCRAGDMTVYIILFRGVGGATQLPTKPLARGADGGRLQGRRHLHQQRQRDPVIEEERRERDGRRGEDLRQGNSASTRRSTR